MKSLAISLLAAFALLTTEGYAQVDVKFPTEGQVLALVFYEYVPQGAKLPMIRVRLGRILLRDGGFVREIPVSPSELNLLPNLLKEQFRLYRGPKQFGIYKYIAVPKERKPKKNDDYLEAMPIDADATVQAMLTKSRLQADILSLLNMTVEEAASAAQNETKLKESLAKAEAAEIELLQKGKREKAPLFFVPVRSQ
jgi:hypothetical protein